MSEQEKIISSLENKGLLDEPSLSKLRARLKSKLETEADENEKELSFLKTELKVLQSYMAG